jgi:triosephosphate isomerase
MSGLANLTAPEVREMVIAYEPVWAIGTGDVAKPDQAAEAINYIRDYVKGVFGPKAAKGLTVLYGGSVEADVVSGFLSVPGVDGFLVGGASLNYHSFANIISGARRWQRNQEET